MKIRTTSDASGRPQSAERDAWAVLAGVDGLGPVGFNGLLARYGSGVAILQRGSVARRHETARRLGAKRRSPAANVDGASTVGVAQAIADAAQDADRILGRLVALGLQVVTAAESGLSATPGDDRDATARPLRPGRPGRTRGALVRRDRRHQTGDGRRTSDRRATRGHARLRRDHGRVRPRDRDRRRGARGDGSCRWHHGRGHRIRSCRALSTDPSAAGRLDRREPAAPSCPSSRRTSDRRTARSRGGIASSAAWPMPRSSWRRRRAAGR